MRLFSRSCVGLALVVATLLLFTPFAALAQNSPLTVTDGSHAIHIFPSVQYRDSIASVFADTGPLNYNGGPVMTTTKAYAIFWIPAKLQNGGATTLTAHYQTVQKNFLTDYPGHTIGSNNTQYFQTVGTTTTYIKDTGSFAGSFVDTNPYPASGCNDGVTGANCFTDAQLEAEIQRVVTLKGWVPNVNTMFLVFTSTGEGSCFDSSGAECSYTQYCAYHSAFTNASNQVVVYSNQPYADTNFCQVPGTPSPTADPAADAAASVASHELTEAITDPELNAWFTAQGNEIGDLCNFVYGTNTWDSAKANQMWNGRFYELQMEWDNHLKKCVQVGP
jgi:hypothetical protein